MKFINKYLIPWVSGLLAIAVTLSLVTASVAETVHISHCLQRCPSLSNDNNEVVVRHLYVASMDFNNGLAEWVAYRVIPDAVGVASLLPRYWQAEELLGTGSPTQVDNGRPRLVQPDLSDAQDRDYRINEFTLNQEDRGRLTPITSFAGTPYWAELNKLSNMAPIPTELRVGAWARLEQSINELSAHESPLYVVSGPLFRIENIAEGEIQNIEGAGPSFDGLLPAAYFKVIHTGSSQAAFVFPRNLPQHADYCAQLDSLDSIEEATGLQLFPAQLGPVSDDLVAALNCEL